MHEMQIRGYSTEDNWLPLQYRGKSIGMDETEFVWMDTSLADGRVLKSIYPEHNEIYLQECIENLARKGVRISR